MFVCCFGFCGGFLFCFGFFACSAAYKAIMACSGKMFVSKLWKGSYETLQSRVVEDVAEFRIKLTCLHYMWPLYDNDFQSECILINLMWSTILGFSEPVGSTVKKIFLMS